jgi:prepilin-type N-terminal cleavage/methylation domain-containing protein
MRLDRARRAGDESGFTLLEVIVAMALLGVGLLAIAAAQLSALRVAGQSRYLSEAMNLAAQRMELFQLTPVANLPAAGTHNDPGNPIQPDTGDDNATRYNRSWTITPNSPAPGVTTILVRVDWVDSTGNVRSTRLESMRGF